jgi:hypothetical protein
MMDDGEEEEEQDLPVSHSHSSPITIQYSLTLNKGDRDHHMEHGAWSMEHGAWSMEHGAWSMTVNCQLSVNGLHLP